MSPDSPFTLDGAAVLVTGASGGLGRAIVAELARRGTRIVAAGRDGTRLDELATGAEADAIASCWAGDLRDDGAPERVVADSRAALDGLDIVVNAAGVVTFGPVAELDPEIARQLLDVDALVPMRLAAAALPRIANGGAFVNLTGIAGEQSIAGMAAYCGAKAAAASFMKAAAREGRRAGIRVLDARPPHTETGLAGRPLAGTAPAMPTGLAPQRVAATIVDALVNGDRDLPPAAFQNDPIPDA